MFVIREAAVRGLQGVSKRIASLTRLDIKPSTKCKIPTSYACQFTRGFGLKAAISTVHNAWSVAQ